MDVTFTNFGEPRHITYDLVFEDGGWRINDLAGENPDFTYRLSEIFANRYALGIESGDFSSLPEAYASDDENLGGALPGFRARFYLHIAKSPRF